MVVAVATARRIHRHRPSPRSARHRCQHQAGRFRDQHRNAIEYHSLLDRSAGLVEVQRVHGNDALNTKAAHQRLDRHFAKQVGGVGAGVRLATSHSDSPVVEDDYGHPSPGVDRVYQCRNTRVKKSAISQQGDDAATVVTVVGQGSIQPLGHRQTHSHVVQGVHHPQRR